MYLGLVGLTASILALKALPVLCGLGRPLVWEIYRKELTKIHISHWGGLQPQITVFNIVPAMKSSEVQEASWC